MTLTDNEVVLSSFQDEVLKRIRLEDVLHVHSAAGKRRLIIETIGQEIYLQTSSLLRDELIQEMCRLVKTKT